MNRRREWTALAALAGGVAVLGTACASTPAVQQAASGPNRPVTYPACTAQQLSGRPGGAQEGMQFTQFVVLTNTGTKTCVLRGGPAGVTGIERDGTRRVLSAGAVGTVTGGFGNLTGPPATIAPGHSAQFALYTTAQCPATAGVAYTALTVRTGRAGTVRVPLPHGLPASLCGPLSVSGFGTPRAR